MSASKTTAFQHGNRNLISITIDRDQVEDLDALATQRRTSRAALIREAIDLYLRTKREAEAASAA